MRYFIKFLQTIALLSLSMAALQGCGTPDQTSTTQSTVRITATPLPFGRAFKAGRSVELKKKNGAGWYDKVNHGTWLWASPGILEIQWDDNTRFRLTPDHLGFVAPKYYWISPLDSCLHSGAAEEVGGNNNNGQAYVCSSEAADGSKVLMYPKREDRLRLRFLTKDMKEIAEYELDTQE